MKICPFCDHKYEENLHFCVLDGHALIEDTEQSIPTIDKNMPISDTSTVISDSENDEPKDSIQNNSASQHGAAEKVKNLAILTSGVTSANAIAKNAKNYWKNTSL